MRPSQKRQFRERLIKAGIVALLSVLGYKASEQVVGAIDSIQDIAAVVK
jgi:hypothetical protein